ncbi:MAG: hypothetical protein MHM6MM_004458 [Cercozoa sp. M6MM]
MRHHHFIDDLTSNEAVDRFMSKRSRELKEAQLREFYNPKPPKPSKPPKPTRREKTTSRTGSGSLRKADKNVKPRTPKQSLRSLPTPHSAPTVTEPRPVSRGKQQHGDKIEEGESVAYVTKEVFSHIASAASHAARTKQEHKRVRLLKERLVEKQKRIERLEESTQHTLQRRREELERDFRSKQRELLRRRKQLDADEESLRRKTVEKEIHKQEVERIKRQFSEYRKAATRREARLKANLQRVQETNLALVQELEQLKEAACKNEERRLKQQLKFREMRKQLRELEQKCRLQETMTTSANLDRTQESESDESLDSASAAGQTRTETATQSRSATPFHVRVTQFDETSMTERMKETLDDVSFDHVAEAETTAETPSYAEGLQSRTVSSTAVPVARQSEHRKQRVRTRDTRSERERTDNTLKHEAEELEEVEADRRSRGTSLATLGPSIVGDVEWVEYFQGQDIRVPLPMARMTVPWKPPPELSIDMIRHLYGRESCLQHASVPMHSVRQHKKRICKFEDGSRRVQFDNGASKFIFRDATALVLFPNGDIRYTTNNCTSVLYLFVNARILHLQHRSGLQIYYFGSTQREVHFVDGTKDVWFADGTRRFLQKESEAPSHPSVNSTFSSVSSDLSDLDSLKF